MTRPAGPRRLTIVQADARLRAIAKLDAVVEAAKQPPSWSRPDHDVQADLRAAVEAAELELPGHHLQRAAAENA